MKDLRSAARERTVPVFLCFAFFAAWALTAMTPLLADDFLYAFSYANNLRLDTLESVLSSLRAHRAYINGRVPSHFLVMCFLTKPKWVFNLCNALVLTLLLGAQACFLRVWGRERLLPLSGALVWLCMPVFGQVFLWLDGACNYAWGLMLALWVLLPFYRSCCKGEWTWPLWKKLAFLPLCLVAGMYSEHISFSLLAASSLLLLARALEEKRLRLYPLLALGCCVIGYGSLLLSPPMRRAIAALLDGGGNGVLLRLLLGLLAALILALLGLKLLRALLRRGKRAALCRTLRLLVLLGWLGAAALLGLGALREEAAALAALQAWLSSSALGLLSALALWALSLLSALLRGAEKRRVLSAALLGFGGLSCFALLPMASYIPARATASAVLFLLLAALSLIELPRRALLRRVVTVGAALLLALSLLLGLTDIVALHRQGVAREREIREQLATGTDTVYIHAYGCATKYAALYGLADLEPVSAEWPRYSIGCYYGIEHAIALPRE